MVYSVWILFTSIRMNMSFLFNILFFVFISRFFLFFWVSIYVWGFNKLLLYMYAVYFCMLYLNLSWIYLLIHVLLCVFIWICFFRVVLRAMRVIFPSEGVFIYIFGSHLSWRDLEPVEVNQLTSSELEAWAYCWIGVLLHYKFSTVNDCFGSKCVA